MEIIFGAIVSLIVQGIKKFTGTNEMGTLLTVVAISIVGAVAYEFLVSAGYWENLVTILVSAGGIYALIIKRFE